MAPEPELTEETLQAQLNAYHQAFKSEFEASVAANEDEVTQATLNFFKKEVPNAAAQIVWLAHNAESEAVRQNCLKFIIAQGLSDAKNDGDPIKELIKQLTKPKTSTPTPASG